MVFDMHLNSMRNANVKTLWEDDVHPHYVMRRYAEFTASLIRLNVEYGDGQVGHRMKVIKCFYFCFHNEINFSKYVFPQYCSLN